MNPLDFIEELGLDDATILPDCGAVVIYDGNGRWVCDVEQIDPAEVDGADYNEIADILPDLNDFRDLSRDDKIAAFEAFFPYGLNMSYNRKVEKIRELKKLSTF